MDFFNTIVTEQAKKNVLEVLNSGRLSEGEWVVRFEQELEKQLGYRNCVAVSSGTSALHLALILAGVKQGDEVILPAQTFVATGLAVLYCGATPVFADIGMDGNISVDSVSSKITEKTRAVICVSWGGNPCDLFQLERLCSIHGLILIQDNAQAFGATHHYPLSEFGDFSCFSFQATKHLTTGDGGLLTCKGDLDYLTAKRLRWFGISRDTNLPDETGERSYDLWDVGHKYQMTNISAALGLGNLEASRMAIADRKMLATMYDNEISQEYQVKRHHGGSCWLYDLLVDNRSDFIRMMRWKDIPVSVVHVGIDRNQIFGGKVMENTTQRHWDEHHICIPCHSSLTDEDVHKVIDAIKGGW